MCFHCRIKDEPNEWFLCYSSKQGGDGFQTKKEGRRSFGALGVSLGWVLDSSNPLISHAVYYFSIAQANCHKCSLPFTCFSYCRCSSRCSPMILIVLLLILSLIFSSDRHYDRILLFYPGILLFNVMVIIYDVCSFLQYLLSITCIRSLLDSPQFEFWTTITTGS